MSYSPAGPTGPLFCRGVVSLVSLSVVRVRTTLEDGLVGMFVFAGLALTTFPGPSSLHGV